MPTEIDMGPKSRLALSEIFKCIVAARTVEAHGKRSKQCKQSRFKRALKPELERAGTYVELLAALERAFLESRRKLSLRERLRNALMAWQHKSTGRSFDD
jgi:hypothetical protein